MAKSSGPDDDYTTLQVAELLGMAVRSIQLMVDRGELEAWKTPGGHRRISRASVERWRAQRQPAATRQPRPAEPAPSPVPEPAAAMAAGNRRVLVIEDSKHYQKLVSLLLREHLPEYEVQVADDGIAGLAMAGQLQPRLLIVDILLPGIDGATLIMSLRSHPQFEASGLVVITSLDDADLGPYRFALEGVAIVHKSRLVVELPARLREVLARDPANR